MGPIFWGSPGVERLTPITPALADRSLDVRGAVRPAAVRWRQRRSRVGRFASRARTAAPSAYTRLFDRVSADCYPAGASLATQARDARQRAARTWRTIHSTGSISRSHATWVSTSTRMPGCSTSTRTSSAMTAWRAACAPAACAPTSSGPTNSRERRAVRGLRRAQPDHVRLRGGAVRHKDGRDQGVCRPRVRGRHEPERADSRHH